MSDKLPEWPEKPEQGVDVYTMQGYWMDTSRAALARMEALMERTEHAYGCEKTWKVVPGPDTTECTCGLSELLAACERNEDGR